MVPEAPPIAGTVIRYSYLWKRGANRRRDEGEKDRPVALLLAKAPGEGECIVLPITHSPPNDPADAVEIPEIERRRLGLDQERSWILLTEFNAFFWPGADLRPIPNEDPSTVIYGMLSRQLFARVLERVKARLRARLVGRVSRT
jgi:hypothetical protein